METPGLESPTGAGREEGRRGPEPARSWSGSERTGRRVPWRGPRALKGAQENSAESGGRTRGGGALVGSEQKPERYRWSPNPVPDQVRVGGGT